MQCKINVYNNGKPNGTHECWYYFNIELEPKLSGKEIPSGHELTTVYSHILAILGTLSPSGDTSQKLLDNGYDQIILTSKVKDAQKFHPIPNDPHLNLLQDDLQAILKGLEIKIVQ